MNEMEDREGLGPEKENSDKSLASLAELAKAVRGVAGDEALNKALAPFADSLSLRNVEPTPVREELPTPTSKPALAPVPLPIAEQAASDSKSAAVWPFVLLAGVVGGALIGWAGRGSLFAPPVYSNYRPATLAEAHRILNRRSGPVVVTTKTGPAKVAPKPKSTPAKVTNPKPPPSFEPGHMLAPLPVPLGGSISGGLPDAGGFEISAPPADIHALEAKVRTAVADAGAHVTRVREGSSGGGGKTKTLTVSVSEKSVHSLMRRLSSVVGGHGMVMESEADDSSNAGADPERSAELEEAKENLAAVKKELDKDEIAFLPQAPALSSVRAQYAEALKTVERLRRIVRPAASLTVVLAAD